MVVGDKHQGKPASIDLLRIYGHPYFKYHQEQLFHTQKAQRVDELLMSYGFSKQEKWEVDDDTLVTLHDMSKLQREWASLGEKDKLQALQKDFKTVLKLGEQIKHLQQELKYINARAQFDQLK